MQYGKGSDVGHMSLHASHVGVTYVCHLFAIVLTKLSVTPTFGPCLGTHSLREKLPAKGYETQDLRHRVLRHRVWSLQVGNACMGNRLMPDLLIFV